MKIFVVGGDLKIVPNVEVSERSWGKGCFIAKIGKQPIIVLKEAWSKFTTYAGFENRKEAERFIKSIKEAEKKEKKGGHDRQ